MSEEDYFKDVPREVMHAINNKLQYEFGKFEKDLGARLNEMERRIEARIEKAGNENFASIGIRSNDSRDELKDLIRFVKEFRARRQKLANESWVSVIRWIIPAALGAAALWLQEHFSAGSK